MSEQNYYAADAAMSEPKYKITDSAMIEELKQCSDEIERRFIALRDKLNINLDIAKFQHPLDKEIIGDSGILGKLSIDGDKKTIAYSNADQLDKLWIKLLEKSIICLRFFDKREPFLNNPQKTIIAYGIDNLNDYHRRYTDFESLMYGASSYYRDHVFHAIRVWFLGVFCLIKPMQKEDVNNSAREPFIDSITLDGGAFLDEDDINFFEKISMWTIIALCHDLGYPLEKADQIIEKTRKMMKEFIPSPNVWNNFGYSGVQDSINEYILKFISTKMKPCSESNKKYFGRIQPKYYLKYAKSLEHFQHGIISAVIIYKMLLYFLESDFNLNDDYVYEQEDARQFYIRREILRAIASHTCPDAYNIHITTFSSLLFLCDELQEWGRKSWNELYTGLSDSSISLAIYYFEPRGIEVSENISMEGIKVEDKQIVIDNIVRVFKRQYSLYKTTFRDGQDTAKRDFDLKKTMKFCLPSNGATNQSILVSFALLAQGKNEFSIQFSNLKKEDKKKYTDDIRGQVERLQYGSDLKFVEKVDEI